MESLKTIECSLVPSKWVPPSKKNPDPIAIASEEAKQLIWQLSVASTQLCKTLNDRIGQHPDFETWKTNKGIPDKVLKELWNSERSNSPYMDLPERFNRSAWLRIQSIYAGWFKKQERCLARLNGLNRWLSILKSDPQLVETSGYELEKIQTRANTLIVEIKARLEELKKCAEGDKSDNDEKHLGSTFTKTVNHRSGNLSNRRLATELFNTYFSLAESNENLLDQCAIVHLLKNGCKIAVEPEDPSQFALKYHTIQKKIQRLEKQLKARLPRTRDLGDGVLRALSEDVCIFTQDNTEFAVQLANLQKTGDLLPYPVSFYSSDDLEWQLIKRKHPVTQEIEERIFVRFKGLKSFLRKQLKRKEGNQKSCKEEYVFEICCDRRQRRIFQQFLEDWETYSSGRSEFSSGSFLLKSASLCWRVKKQGNDYQLYLQCTYNHQDLTSEGAELTRAEKIAQVKKRLDSYEVKQQDGKELTDDQMTDLKRLQSQLARLNNPLPRPSKPQYKGNPNLIVGVSFSLETVVNVAVVDCATQEVLTYRSAHQLLGKDYQLLSAYRLKQGRNANKRHKQQKRGKVSNLSESNQGKHIDRLLAKAILEVVQEFKAASLALPQLTGLRESIQSEIEAKAELRYPGDQTKQDEYKKQYKVNVHRWSYARLINSLRDRATKVGVSIESGQQPSSGDLEYKSAQLALSAYFARRNVAI